MLIFKRLLEYGLSKYWIQRILTFPCPLWPCRQKCSKVTTPHPPRIHCRDVKQQIYANKSFVQLKTRFTPKSGFFFWTIVVIHQSIVHSSFHINSDWLSKLYTYLHTSTLPTQSALFSWLSDLYFNCFWKNERLTHIY